MFGSKHRAERRAAEEASEKGRATTELRANLVDLIGIAGGAVGDAGDWPLVLKPGERLVYAIQGGGLFEPRRMPGHWKGRSAGVSVPVVDGIRLRFGKSAGTFVQGDETPTVIDSGDVSVTTKRVVFQGSKDTREWDYSKLIGIMHYADQPRTAIQVSNRQKTSGIAYPGLAPDLVRLRLTVAVAIFNGEANQIAQQLRDELAKLDETAAPDAVQVPSDSHAPPAATDGADSTTDTPETDETLTRAVPVAAPDSGKNPPTGELDHASQGSSNPAMASQPRSALSGTPPVVPPPMWAADPSGAHQSRYWDGGKWTDFVADDGHTSRDPLPPPEHLK